MTNSLPAPGTSEFRTPGCTCPSQDQDQDDSLWTVDGDGPLHGYGSPGEDQTLRD